MEEWKEVQFNEEDNSEEDLDEDSEEPELEETLEPDTNFDQGFEEEQFQPRPMASSGVNPFLEAEEPIENLEQELQDVPTQTTGPETGGLEEQGYSDVSAQYAEAGAYEDGVGGYEGGVDYGNTTVTGSPETDINRALSMRPSDVTLNTDLGGAREMNFSRWHQHAMGSDAGPSNTQQERYVPAPKRQDITSGLPFQDRKNPKRF